MTAVFDGHNDALGSLQADGEPARGLPHRPARAPHRPPARAGRRTGRRPVRDQRALAAEASSGARGLLSDMPYVRPGRPRGGDGLHAGAVGRAHALAAASDGAVAVVTDVAALDRCRAAGALAMVLHLEGAEAIDPGLAALDAWHAAGVRSLGLVWSRPSAFGHGVPFRFPASPDTGPGLTDAGRALVRALRASSGSLVDVSHLNAAGFADVARLAAAPLVASHSRVPRAVPRDAQPHRRPAARDRRAATGIVGIVFAPPFLRADGADDADTPLSTLVAHVRHAAEVAGIDHVGLGSDFDGAPMPAELGDVAALPRLLDALRDDGFSADEVRAHRVGQLAARARGGLGRRSAPTPRAAARTRRCRPPARARPRAGAARPRREAQAPGQGERAGVVGGRGQLEAPHPGVVEEPVHEHGHRAPAQPGAAGRAGQPEPDLGAPLPASTWWTTTIPSKASDPPAVTASLKPGPGSPSRLSRNHASSGSSSKPTQAPSRGSSTKAAAKAGASSARGARSVTTPSASRAGAVRVRSSVT